MASLDDIVNPVVTLESSGLTGAGFGTVMVTCVLPTAAATAWAPDVVREYAKAADMLDDGFTVKDAGYKIVASAFSQAIKPSKVKVGRRTLPMTQIVKFQPTNTTPGFMNKFYVQGQFVSHANGGAETQTTISTALITAGNLLTATTGVTFSIDNTTGLKGTATAGLVAEYTSISAGITVTDATTDPGIATDLAAISAADPDWYHLLIDSFGAAEIEATAAWCDAEGFVFYQAQTGDTANVTASYSSSAPADVSSYLKAHGIARTACWWNQDLAFTLAPAICGEEASKTPGSSIYRFKNLSGPVASDQLTAAQVAKLKLKNCNYYQTLGNLGRTMSGRIAGGSYLYIDNVIFLDWWRNTCQVNVAAYIVSKDKVSYTDAGIEGAAAQVRLTNSQGVQNLGIAPGTATVTAPKAADMTAASKEGRNLPGIKVDFELAGAIETVNPISATVRF